MLKEIAWYLKDDRFSDMVVELDTAVRQYDSASSVNNDEGTQNSLREQARELFETHCLASGLRSEDAPYINIDQEFFDGETLDEKALDTFIKNIVKGYCYQKVLWTYMGTTGNFTQISKEEMKNQGLQYEDYLPIQYKKDNPPKKPLEHLKDDNTVLFYAYSDGTISQEYFPEKAKIRFDALQDTSGFDWKKAYNPNNEVKKNGWVGAYDEEGTWVQVKAEDIKNSSGSKPITKDILLIKDGDSAILYDPGMALLFSAAQLYLTEEDEVYGSLEYSEKETVAEIKSLLSEMGVSSIKTLAGLDVQNKDTVDAYVTLLAGIVDPAVTVVGKKEAVNLLKAKKEENQRKEDEGLGVHFEKRIQVSCGMGCSAKDIKKSFIEQKIAVPLSFKNAQDAKKLSLNDEEYDYIQKFSVSEKNQQSFDASLCNILAAWPQFAGSGVSKIELADMVYSYVEKKKTEKRVLNAETTLSNIFSGDTVEEKKDGSILFSSGIPGVFAEDAVVDFYTESERNSYIERLETKHILPKNGAEVVKECLMTLPSVSLDKKEKLNRALTRSLGQYKTIAMSTGLPIKEVVAYAVAHAQEGDASAMQSKRVYYEVPLKTLMAESAKQNYQKKEVEIYVPTNTKVLDDSVSIVVGGVSGTPLNNVVELESNRLTSEYGYSEQEASNIEQFLHSVTVRDDISAMDFDPVREMLFSHLTGRSSSEVLEKDMLNLFDSSTNATYNLTNDIGFNAYVETNRFKNSSLTKAELEQIVSFDKSSTKRESPQALHDRVTVKPRYVSSNVPVNFSRTSPKGTPEKIYTQSAPNIAPYVPNIVAKQEKVLDIDTIVIADAKTELSGMYGYAQEGVNTNFLLPALLVGENSMSDFVTGVSAQDILNTNSIVLKEKFGYESSEGEKIVQLLGSMKVPQGRERYFAQELQPVIESALATNRDEKGFREAVMKDLGVRADTAFNLRSSVGKSSYMQTESFRNSGLDEAGLKEYIQRVPSTSGMSQNSPVYARAITTEGMKKEPLQTVGIRQGNSIVIDDAKTELSGMYDYAQEGVNSSFLLPALLVGEDGMNATVKGISAQDILNTSSIVLKEKFGYESSEGEKIVKLLGSMKVPQGRETYFTQELQPVIESALATNRDEKGFREAVMKDLGMRADTAFNLRSPVGKSSYMQTESFRNSGLDEVGLIKYIQQVPPTSGMSKNSPVYARAITTDSMKKEPLQTVAIRQGNSIVIDGAKTELSGMYDYAQEGVTTSFLLPALLVGENSMNTSIRGLSAQDILNTSSIVLKEKFGYESSEGEKIVKLLGSMKVPQGRERYFAQELQPVIESALAGKVDEKGFREAVMKDLGMRADTAFNLKSSVGKSSYMQTESFRNSGLDEVGLIKYIQQVPPTSGMSQNSPVYARAITTDSMKKEPLQTVAIRQGSSIVIDGAKTELNGMYDYAQEGVNTNFLLPALLVGENSKSDFVRGISAQDILNTSSTVLKEKFGYESAEGEKIVKLLGSMKVPQGREPYFAQELQPVIESALAANRDEKGFREAVMKDLGVRGDTAFNLKSPVGKTSYMQTESFRNSGIDEAGLIKYIQQVPSKSGMSKHSPVYARAITGRIPAQSTGFGTSAIGNTSMSRAMPQSFMESMQTGMFRHSTNSASTGRVPLQTVAFRQGRNNTATSPVSLQEMEFGTSAIGNTGVSSAMSQSLVDGIKNEPLQTVAIRQGMNSTSTGRSSAQSTELGVSAINNTSMSSGMPKSAVSSSLNYEKPSVQPKTATSPVNDELQRLRKMEENYEKDKAMLRKEAVPALARSASHDIGHAEDDGVAMVADEDDVKQMNRKLNKRIKTKLAETD